MITEEQLRKPYVSFFKENKLKEEELDFKIGDKVKFKDPFDGRDSADIIDDIYEWANGDMSVELKNTGRTFKGKDLKFLRKV